MQKQAGQTTFYAAEANIEQLCTDPGQKLDSLNLTIVSYCAG